MASVGFPMDANGFPIKIGGFLIIYEFLDIFLHFYEFLTLQWEGEIEKLDERSQPMWHSIEIAEAEAGKKERHEGREEGKKTEIVIESRGVALAPLSFFFSSQ